MVSEERVMAPPGLSLRPDSARLPEQQTFPVPMSVNNLWGLSSEDFTVKLVFQPNHATYYTFAIELRRRCLTFSGVIFCLIPTRVKIIINVKSLLFNQGKLQ
jgi:hypothetical protein